MTFHAVLLVFFVCVYVSYLNNDASWSKTDDLSWPLTPSYLSHSNTILTQSRNNSLHTFITNYFEVQKLALGRFGIKGLRTQPLIIIFNNRKITGMIRNKNISNISKTMRPKSKWINSTPAPERTLCDTYGSYFFQLLLWTILNAPRCVSSFTL